MGEIDSSATIAARFVVQVDCAPDAIAIDTGTQRIRYDELNRRANRLAHAIRSEAVSPDTPVAFLLEDGVEQIVAVLALFKAARIAVPLDPGYPPARLRAMLADSGCRLVLQNRATASLRAELAPGCSVLDFDQAEAFDDANPAWPVEAGSVANIYYTSGTTGEPKGVLQTQANVLRFVKEMAGDWHVTPQDRFVQLVSCSFSAVLLPILVPLLHGAAVVPFDLRREGIAQLGQVLARQRITVLFCVPSVLRALPASAGEGRGAAQLRLCVLTGEPLYWSDVARLETQFGPRCSAINLFGGSEMHHVASLRLDAAPPHPTGLVPAGRPAPGKELLLLDAAGEPVPRGQVGELLVRSRHLSPGYWRRDDLTRDAFVEAQDGSGVRGYRTGDLGRFNDEGLLELVGRADSRVKLRGQLVETAAVEAVIASCPGVTEVAVCLVAGDGNAGRLVAFVATERFDATTWPALDQSLRLTIPAFMIPTSFLHVPALPRGPGGKIDRAALAELFASRRRHSDEYTPPRNAVERRIVAAVELVLEQHPIGVTDDLFDLGLDSLLYADLQLLLEQEFVRRLPDEVFVHARTVEQLAAIEPPQPRATADPAVPGGGQDYHKSWARLDREMRARYLAAHALGALPFRAGLAGLDWIGRGRWFRSAWPVREHVKLVQDFLTNIESNVDREQALTRSLRCNYAQPWLLRSLARCAARHFERACSVEGIEHFEYARRQGRGVILAVSHFGIPHADLLILNWMGQKGIATLGSFEHELRLMNLAHTPHVPLVVEPVENFVFRANFLRHARDVLDDGGVVRIAADGLHGTRGRTWPFHGRRRHFRPGLGELAVDTRAPVVPAFGVLANDGRVEVQFLPELEPPDEGLPRPDGVETYMGQYVGILERRWALDPGSVVWEIARSHLASPRTDPR